ncbi:MAG: 50S ribosomal protein L23 [Parcubacteria group bacterium]|nr:50S ribosomal protein L23 [Parcubacteria group bacterium]
MALFDLFKNKKKGKGDDAVTAKPARETATAETRARAKQSGTSAEAKEKKQNRATKAAVANTRDAAEGGEVYAPLILKPFITEKSSFMSADGAYVFAVSNDATKNEIKKAIKEMYKVTPRRVNIMTQTSKTRYLRGRIGVRARPKKAIVFLKKGDRIEFV